MPEDRKPNLAPEEGPNGVDRWTSNGCGITISGKKVVPLAEEDEKRTDDINEIDEK